MEETIRGLLGGHIVNEVHYTITVAILIVIPEGGREGGRGEGGREGERE